VLLLLLLLLHPRAAAGVWSWHVKRSKIKLKFSGRSWKRRKFTACFAF